MTSKPYPSRVADQFVVRMPDGMRDRLAEAAKANSRSMNNEIVDRLQQSFYGLANEVQVDAMGERIQELEAERDRAHEVADLRAQHLGSVAKVAQALLSHMTAEQRAHIQVRLATEFLDAAARADADGMALAMRQVFSASASAPAGAPSGHRSASIVSQANNEAPAPAPARRSAAKKVSHR